MKTPLLALLLVAVASAAACEDVSPLPYTALPEVDAAPEDGAVDPGDVARCQACGLGTEGECQAEQATCGEDPRCTRFIECMAELDCWRGFDVANLPTCVTTCGDRIGSSVNELIPLAGPYFTCILTSCFEPCFAVPALTDAGR